MLHLGQFLRQGILKIREVVLLGTSITCVANLLLYKRQLQPYHGSSGKSQDVTALSQVIPSCFSWPLLNLFWVASLTSSPVSDPKL